MYRWQTLTMAKIEANARAYKTTDAQIQAAKRLLLDIGLQHFPEPEIDYFSPPAGYADGRNDLILRWVVDDRKIESFLRLGVDEPCFALNVGPEGGSDRYTAYSPKAAVQYLLFGPVSWEQLQPA